MSDPIVDEIRAIRERLAAELNFDMHKMAEHARTQARELGLNVVSRPRRIPDVMPIAAPPLSVGESLGIASPATITK